MLAFLIVSIRLLVSMGILSYVIFNKSVNLTMDFLTYNGQNPYYQEFTDRFGEEAPYTIKYFIATFNRENNSIAINSNSLQTIDQDTIYKFINEILKEKDEGWVNNYRYRIIRNEDSDRIIFVNFEKEIISREKLMQITILVFIIVNCLLFYIMIKISPKAVEPIEKNIRRQKEFISDASHEIRTPLAIISANTDVLELQIGENDWLESNKRQVRRLTKLVNQMLALTKYESDDVIYFENVDVKELVSSIIEEYEILFDKEGIKINLDLNELTSYTNKDGLAQIIYTLLDNALKYTNEEKYFKVSIRNREIWFENSSDPIDKEDLKNLFNRFYRVDKSRSREKGGNGIGLSLAKTISDYIEADLDVEMKENNIIRFIIRLPS